MTRARRVTLLTLAFYALVDELIAHAVFRILARLQDARMVAELTRAKLELRNDVRILTRHGDHGLWVEHVCNQHPDAHVRPSLAKRRLLEQPNGLLGERVIVPTFGAALLAACHRRTRTPHC